MWNWSFGDGEWFNTTDPAQKDPIHTYTTAGTFTVNLTAGNTGGSDTVSHADYITVSSVPTFPTADFSGNVCHGKAPLAVAFTDESDVFLGTMWNWSFGDGDWENSTISSAPCHTYAAGTYTVSLTVTNASGSSTRTRAGYITAAIPLTPTPVITSSPDPPSGGDGSDSDERIEPLRTVYINVGGNTAVTSATITGTIVDGIVVTAIASDGTGTNLPRLPGILVYEYLMITPLHYGTITGATILFNVPQSWLDENHINPQDVVLYRYTGGQWVALPTTLVKTANGHVYFSARTPGFSWFAIGAAEHPVTATMTQALQPMSGNLIAASPADAAMTAGTAAAPDPALTTTTIAPTATPSNEPGFPYAAVAVIGAGCVVLIGGGWYVRRWWIRRQNPALFREYD
jgi:PGF-pre-PGF domain-containing protein